MRPTFENSKSPYLRPRPRPRPRLRLRPRLHLPFCTDSSGTTIHVRSIPYFACCGHYFVTDTDSMT
jgi:hypothetical protein